MVIIKLHESDFVRAMRLDRAWSRLKRRVVLLVLLGAAIAAGVLWSRGSTAFVTIVACGLIFGVIGATADKYLLDPIRQKRVFRLQKSDQHEFVLLWNDHALTIDHGDGAYATEWRDILRCKEDRDLLLIYLSETTFIILPKRAFLIQAEFEELQARLAGTVAPHISAAKAASSREVLSEVLADSTAHQAALILVLAAIGAGALHALSGSENQIDYAPVATSGARENARIGARWELKYPSSQDRYYLALEAYKRGQLSRAEVLLREILRDTPDELLAQSTLGTTLFAQRRYADARRMFELCLENNPSYSEAYLGLGAVDNAQRLYDAAIVNYSNALLAQPNHAGAHLGRGYAYFNKQDYGRARIDLNRSIELLPPEARLTSDAWPYLKNIEAIDSNRRIR
jgi:tetratricopeptide (TPR) repeat protein